MKKTTVMNTAAGALAALLLGGTALAHGVNEGYINEEVLRGNRGAQQQPINRGPTAAEVDAWNRRERQVQSRIAEYRRTPFYMAVAYDIPNKRVVAAGGYRSEARAVEETMRRCGRGREERAEWADWRLPGREDAPQSPRTAAGGAPAPPMVRPRRRR